MRIQDAIQVDVAITKAGLRFLKQMDDQRAPIDEIYANRFEKEAAPAQPARR